MVSKYDWDFNRLGGLVSLSHSVKKAVSAVDLESVEHACGCLLPSDYRHFLRLHGESTTGQPAFVEALQDLPQHISTSRKVLVGLFYGTGSGQRSIEVLLRRYAGRIPRELLPIADDGVGNQICLRLAGTERGKIYLWDHHEEVDPEDYFEEQGSPLPVEMQFRNVHLVANSFDDFARRMMPLQK